MGTGSVVPPHAWGLSILTVGQKTPEPSRLTLCSHTRPWHRVQGRWGGWRHLLSSFESHCCWARGAGPELSPQGVTEPRLCLLSVQRSSVQPLWLL